MYLHLEYFPFPSVRNGKFHDGIIQSWPTECTKCASKDCLSDEIPLDEIQQCNCGLNYIRVKKGFAIGGIKISPDPGVSPLINSSNCTLHVSAENISTAVAPRSPRLDLRFSQVQLWNYYSSPVISQELSQETNFVDSYRCLANSLLNRLKEDMESPGISFQNNYYRQVFWSCKYFCEILSAFEFIYDPSILTKTYKCIPLKPAPQARKQTDIIATRYNEKKLKFSFLSENSKLITVHPKVISTLFFTLMDNAAKFAPKKSKILIQLKDNNNGTTFSVKSIGPQIMDYESEDIYKAKYTGKASPHPESPGLGLYIASKLASTHLQKKIFHHQKKLKNNKFETIFSIDIPEKAGILF